MKRWTGIPSHVIHNQVRQVQWAPLVGALTETSLSCGSLLIRAASTAYGIAGHRPRAEGPRWHGPSWGTHPRE